MYKILVSRFFNAANIHYLFRNIGQYKVKKYKNQRNRLHESRFCLQNGSLFNHFL